MSKNSDYINIVKYQTLNEKKQGTEKYIMLFFFFFFLQSYLQYMELPSLGVESEL